MHNHWLATFALGSALALPACTISEASPNESGEGGTTDADASESEGTSTEGDTEGDAEQSCGTRDTPDATADELATNAMGELEVGTTMFGALASEHRNVLLSPYSLRSAFGQTYAGAQGASHQEIARIFAFEDLGPQRVHDVLNTVSQGIAERSAPATEAAPELIVRPLNRSFLDTSYEESVEDDWIARVQASYGTCLEVFDMNVDQDYTLDHVNGWVASQTNDLIPNLVKELPESVALIIVNALYFKAAWATAFEPSRTADAPFTNLSGQQVNVEMMHAPIHPGAYAQAEQWQAVALPYNDPGLEMVVILPEVGTQPAFEAALDATMLSDLFDTLEPAVIDLRLPKFDLMSTWSLRPTLEGLGMSAAFENGEDFSPIAEGMEPIAFVFHDVAIAIDEKGTEAAAATAVVFGGDDGGDEPEPVATMVVDRTFYLAIRDREFGAVLFFARIGELGGG